MGKMSANKLKIMSEFNNSLKITLSVQNCILLDSRFYWEHYVVPALASRGYVLKAVVWGRTVGLRAFCL